MILARAPFRVPLGGGGTDLPSYYSNHGGLIVSAAINKYVYIAVNKPSADNAIRVKYSKSEKVRVADEVQHDLVRPALKMLELGASLEIVSLADAPDGTGLGSSSAYLVCLLTALYALKREKIPTQVLAEEAFHVEMNLAGHPVGKQDHYLAAFGGVTCLNIEPDGKVHVRPVDISMDTLDDLRNNLLMFYTGMQRSATDILHQQKSDTEAGSQNVIDSLHRTKELGYRILEALETGDIEKFGLLMDEHWQNKKKRSGKISDPQIDCWYELAKQNGALGGKIMGAGGGGFFVFYCPSQHKARLRRALKNADLNEMRYDFDLEGAKVLVNM